MPVITRRLRDYGGVYNSLIGFLQGASSPALKAPRSVTLPDPSTYARAVVPGADGIPQAVGAWQRLDLSSTAGNTANKRRTEPVLSDCWMWKRPPSTVWCVDGRGADQGVGGICTTSYSGLLGDELCWRDERVFPIAAIPLDKLQQKAKHSVINNFNFMRGFLHIEEARSLFTEVSILVSCGLDRGWNPRRLSCEITVSLLGPMRG